MSEHEATLERRIYARLDESLGPINEALDAVNTRLDALAASYAQLLGRANRQVAINEADGGWYDQIRGNRTSLAALEGRHSELAERVGQLSQAVITARKVNVEQSQRITHQAHRIDALSDDLISRTYGLKEERDALSDRVSMLENAATTGAYENLAHAVGAYSGRIGNHAKKIETLETRSYAQGEKIEELTHALEDHEHSATTGAAFLPADNEALGAGKVQQIRGMLSTLRNEVYEPEPQDTYEVDGRPATKAEYEAAENDPKAPHTTRHVHRPFSDGVSLHSTAHPGSNQLSPESLEEIEIELPEPVHDIGWAMKQLAAGHKVRRGVWKIYSWGLNGDKVRLYSHFSTSGDAVLFEHDLQATDWELV